MSNDLLQAGLKSAGKQNCRLIYKGLQAMLKESQQRSENMVDELTSAEDLKKAREIADAFVNETTRQDVLLEIMGDIAETFKEEGK